MIGNIMYGKLCYKIYVIYVKIRNIRKIRIIWYCYEWLLLIIYDGLFFLLRMILMWLVLKYFVKRKYWEMFIWDYVGEMVSLFICICWKLWLLWLFN